MKILIVEDDANVLELLTSYCDAEGHVFATAADGVAAVERFRADPPDLVLLDIVLPRLDGWEVLRTLRETSDVPVVLLTSLQGAEDAVRGLSLGADDYLRKPFEIKELDARIGALRRRIAREKEAPVVSVGPIRIDDRAKRVTLDESELALTPKELGLLKLLAGDAGRVFSQEEILARVWSDSPRAGAADVKQYVHLLRKKLGRRSGLIQTVERFGYKLVV